jgi:Co/Zn/Cd efflux system component
VKQSLVTHHLASLFPFFSTAMTVDVMTYLFNFGAERMKHRLELDCDDEEREEANIDDDVNPQSPSTYDKQELQRLLLELIPPSISASTLMVVTTLTMMQSIQVIFGNAPKENSPDIAIMLIFSSLNLILDGFNVLEFSKVDHVVLSVTNVHHEHTRHFHRHHHHHHPIHGFGSQTETTPLLPEAQQEYDDDTISLRSMEKDLNLNMCSAWTHIAADTLRSIAVLVAASISALFPYVLSPMDADSLGAILVSIVILVSLGPLIQGIYNTALEIRRLLGQQRI